MLQTIHGRILFMDLEDQNCVWDWLEVTSRFKMIGRFCGTQQVHFRSENIVLMSFQSDNVVNKAGFQLLLQADGKCP
ncbi:cubilin [Plakobranchus ocellatus]|uniref:Cubilin n=1 Tax=Plakobranchus ocellatus TaxID=259542 RepID=A0AAV4BK32_9GAST|nr:cubilin [Plakobranchus ocellatus]